MSSEPLGLIWREEWCSNCLIRSSRFLILKGPTSSSGFICCCDDWSRDCCCKTNKKIRLFQKLLVANCTCCCCWMLGWCNCCWERWWWSNVPVPETSPNIPLIWGLLSQMFSRELFFELLRLYSYPIFPAAHSCKVFLRISSLMLPDGVFPELLCEEAAFLKASRISSW